MKPIVFSDKETPAITLIHDTFHKTTLDDLEADYFKKWEHANKWTCLSDYSLEGDKANDVITFTFFPYVAKLDEIGATIKVLAPREIKHAKTIKPEFVKFLQEFPFLNFSIVLSNHKHMFHDSKEQLVASMLHSVDQMISFIPGWNDQNPHMTEHNKRVKKNLLEIRRLIEQNKKISILKNLFIITSIGSILSTMICNRTNAEIFAWFSDRDSINDICNNFSHNLFHIQFIQHIANQECKFLTAPSTSSSDEWYEELTKIPDYLTGAIADYNFEKNEITHEKFAYLLENFFAGNTNNSFVYKLDFHGAEGITCTRIVIGKKN